MGMLEHALRYAQLGLSVVPLHTATRGKCSCGNSKCDSPGKHPRIKWRGQSSSAYDEGELRAIWRKWPTANIGIVTGSISDLIVIDIDGEQGVAALKEVGLDLDEVFAPAVETGRGGLHIYCRYPTDAAYKILTKPGVLPSVDIRADGGVIVAPPSVHYSGNVYRWVEGMSLEDIELPEIDLSWAVTSSNNGHVKITPSGEQWFEHVLKGVGEGERNDSATRLAGRYLGMGMTASETLMLLENWNQGNDPPLPHRELEVIVDSIATREDAPRDQLQRQEALAKVSKALKTVTLQDVARITGDDPQIILQFKEGRCQISTAALLTPASFVANVASGTKIVVRKLSAKTSPSHATLAQWILDAARDEDAGIEATSAGEMRDLIGDYMDSQRITLVDGSEVPKHGSFRFSNNGAVWISLGELIQWASTKGGGRLSRQQTAQKLKSIGWHKQDFPTDEGSKRTVWAEKH
jgi:hypothetical protein